MLVRPFRLPEWLWAIAGAILLMGFGLVTYAGAYYAMTRGTEVYLFLTGMMALAEVARYEGLFEWIASHAVRVSRASSLRLFGVLFVVGIVVTALLSNDATAIVLTPAVLAAARRCGVPPEPHIFACALVANAASFILPMSNPANLIVFANKPPALLPWIMSFGIASVAAVAITYAVLRLCFRSALRARVRDVEPHRSLNRRQRVTLVVVLLSAAALVTTAAAGASLGIASAACGIASIAVVMLYDRSAPLNVMRDISWSIVPLIAALFVVTEALDQNGATHGARALLAAIAAQPPTVAKLLIGGAASALCNVFNNLPVGLFFAYAAHAPNAMPPRHLYDAGLVAVDLAPNFSVTGSLATLLWLAMLRREGVMVTAMQFLRIGSIVTIPSLLAALLLTR